MADGVIKVQLCSLDRKPLELEAVKVFVPGSEGLFTVLAGHTPFLTMVASGVIVVFGADGQEDYYSVSNGFVEVLDNDVSILAQTFEHQDEIDLDRAKSAGERAEDKLSKLGADVDITRAEAALERSLARVNAHSGEKY